MGEPERTHNMYNIDNDGKYHGGPRYEQAFYKH